MSKIFPSHREDEWIEDLHELPPYHYPNNLYFIKKRKKKLKQRRSMK